jgi:DNA-binding protein HU-beta
MASKKKSKGVLKQIGDAATTVAEVVIDAGSKAIHAVGDMLPAETPKKGVKASPKASKVKTTKSAKVAPKASKAQPKVEAKTKTAAPKAAKKAAMTKATPAKSAKPATNAATPPKAKRPAGKKG